MRSRPCSRMTEHEANNALLSHQRQAVAEPFGRAEADGCRTAAAGVSAKEPARAFELEQAAATKLKRLGVKIVEDVDKTSFQTISDPYLDKLAKELGPHAEKIKNLIRAIN